MRRRYLEWVDLWVERSRQAPLNLYLDLGNLRASHDPKSMSDMEYELDKLLKPIGHRIHHLTFISHSLHDLIHAFDRGKRPMFHGVPSRFLASPHLHTLDFSGIDWAMEVVPDVGTNIIRLSMRNVNPYDITRISRKLPNLQHACFAIVEGDLAKGETLEFPHLTSLTLDFELHHSPDFQAVMKAIRTPSLTTLHLRLRKHLTEDTKWFKQGQLPTIFPRLFEFHLNIALTNSALAASSKAFTLFSHTEALQRCIHLEEIQLEYAGAVLENNLVDMIESRSMHQPPKSARLRKVRVYSSGRVASRNVEQKPLPTSLDVSIERYCSWVYRGDGRRAETKRIWDERYASTGPVSKTLEPCYYSSESESEEDSEDWSDDY
ncbi:hypothetical protein BKA70DRAFT_1398087 [Coprinopsis sp. MPI-PUGE-AT-0042]|nr:hypothetical protein BKA70DRAFT_1398087 [Coprinopsis sp. MPI-PUGE-AT-0042]